MLHVGWKFDLLKTALADIESDVPTPAELATWLADEPMGEWLPTPASIWLFIGLVLFRDRQRWAYRELRRNFPDYFIRKGKIRDLAEDATIPGMPDWRLVQVSDRWGIIGNKAMGEKIVVNRARPVGEPLIFPAQLPSFVPAASPWDIWGRLAANTSGHEMQLAIDDLVAARVLLEISFFDEPWEGQKDPEAYRLALWVRGMFRDVRRFRDLWSEPENRLWLAVLIGDWVSANELAQAHHDPNVKRIVSERFDAYQQRRLVIARCNLTVDPTSWCDLLTLREMQPEEFPSYAETAIELLGANPDLAILACATGDSRWNAYLLKTLQESETHDLLWDMPKIASDLGTALLQRGYCTDAVIDALEGYEDEPERVALVLLKYAPSRALPTIRLGLRHRPPDMLHDSHDPWSGIIVDPASRSRMAAVLAVIDEPWSRRELQEAIEDLWTRCHDTEVITPLALALSESRDPAVRAIGDSWQVKCSGGEKWAIEESRFRGEIISEPASVEGDASPIALFARAFSTIAEGLHALPENIVDAVRELPSGVRRQAESSNQSHDPRPSGTAPNPNNVNKVTS
jgi:hypothetical protein